MSASEDVIESESISSLSHSLANVLHGRIVSGAIPLGSWLRQDAIAEEFGISRTPVREALQALHGQGIVKIVPHRGAVVRGPTPRDIRENCQVRALLESFAAELAAPRIRDEQISRLLDARDQFVALCESYLAAGHTERDRRRLGKAWAGANEQFHSTILEAADNHQLTKSVQDLAQCLPRNLTFSALWGDSHLIQTNVAEHVTIADAISERDGKKASRAVRDHMLRAGDLLMRWYENEIWSKADMV